MSNSDYTIGVVGVGRMGANIAHHLNDEGFSVVAVYDADGERATSLGEEIGAEATDQLARVTELADYIITVVTDDNAMRQIFSEDADDSLLKGASGTTFINCATISPQVHVDVEQLAEKHGASSLEGCMASSITQAREGTLYLMCGGKEDIFNDAKPILDSMSVSLRYIGEAGRAAQVKALVNMVMNINTAGLAEGLGLGARAWVRFGDAARSVLPNWCKLSRPRNRWRRHGGSRSRMLFLRGACVEGFGNRARPCRRCWFEPPARRSDQRSV